MKIAIWLDNSFSATDGGCFSYNSRLIKAIDSYQFSNDLEVCFATFAEHNVTGLNREVVKLSYTPRISWQNRLKSTLPAVGWHVRESINQRIKKEQNKVYIQTLKEHGIKLLYYINQFSSHIPDFPFVTTHWDISYRTSFAFPELCGESEFLIRKNYYQDFLPKALLVFTESKAGMDDLLQYTHLNRERLRIVPLFSGECASMDVAEEEQQHIIARYSLTSGKYFFYPSTFCPSKNHHTLIKAFAEFKKQHPDFKLVLTGAAQEAAHGTFNYNQRIANELNISNDVVFAGFVSIETIYTLYMHATALVMPIYVGSTNMPPLEAMELGCPVICSNLPGHMEELGDAAIYFNPMDIKELHMAMETMVNNRDEYTTRIKSRAKLSTFTLDEALKRIDQYLYEATIIRSAWE